MLLDYLPHWQPINVHFLANLYTAGVNIDWDNGVGIYTRFTISADDDPTPPGAPICLTLEAMILDDGYTIDNLSPEAKEIMNGVQCVTIPLWQCDVNFLLPLDKFQLPTTPGLCITDPEIYPVPSEHLVRLYIDHVIDQSRQGLHAASSEEYRAYIASPERGSRGSPLPRKLVLSLQEVPTFTTVSGDLLISSDMNKLGPRWLTFREGPRKGKTINLSLRNTHNSKYVTVPHPYFELDKSALPAGTPYDIYRLARSNFSASVTWKTQQQY